MDKIKTIIITVLSVFLVENLNACSSQAIVDFECAEHEEGAGASEGNLTSYNSQQAYIVPLDRDDLDLDPLVYQNGTESSMDARLTGRLFAHQTSSFKLPCRFTKPLVSAPVPADNNKETTGKAICSFRSNQSHCQENTWNKNPFQKFQYGSNWQCPRFSYLNLFPPSILIARKKPSSFRWRYMESGVMRTRGRVVSVSSNMLPGESLITWPSCVVLILYSSWSKISAKAAPHLNAVPRAFENIRFVAIDVSQDPEAVSHQFGIYSVPSIVLFSNGKQRARYTNDSFELTSFADFLEKYTDQKALNSTLHLQPNDFSGPIPTVSEEENKTDKLLVLAWAFIFFSVVYGLYTKPAVDFLLQIFIDAQEYLEDLEFKTEID